MIGKGENMKYDTVIFDLDGTLLNTLEDLTDGVNHTMRAFGFPEHTMEQVRCFVGNGIRKLMERAVPQGEKNPLFEEIFAYFKEYYTGHCRIKTDLYPGIREMLAKLKQKGYKLAIVSNKNMEAVQELNDIYFKEFITVAVGDGKGRRRKPYPDSVEYAIAQLGAKKENVLYVGDSEVDSDTAVNTGIDCVLVSWGFREREILEEKRAVAIIDCPEELFHILEGAN